MTSTTESPCRDASARAACLQRLATALSSYQELEVAVRQDGPTPSLAVRNTALPQLSETIAITWLDDSLAFLWSWGERIARASDPDAAAHAIAYVLHARGVWLGMP